MWRLMLRASVLPLLCCLGTTRQWHLLARQTGTPPEANGGGKAFASLNPSDPSAANFGRLTADLVEDFKRPDGTFMFKFSWPEGVDTSFAPACGSLGGTDCMEVWTQTNNPLSSAAAGLKVLVDVPQPGKAGNQIFHGLQPCGGNALVCNAVPWWYCVGCQGVCPAGTFPGSGGCQKVSELWACGADVSDAECLTSAGETGSHSWDLVAAMLLVTGVYVGGGVGAQMARQSGGRKQVTSLGMLLQAHPHYAQWTEVTALCADGLQFLRRGGGRRGGPSARSEAARAGGLREPLTPRGGDTAGSVRSGAGSRSSDKSKKSSRSSKSKSKTPSSGGGSGGDGAEPEPEDTAWRPTCTGHLAVGARETGVKVNL